MNIALDIEAQRFMLVFFRVAAMFWMVPLFSIRTISAIFKGGLSLLIAYLLYDVFNINAVLQADPFALFLAVLKEVFVGATIGLVVRLVFVSASMSGEIISLQSGMSFARFMDPFSMTQVSILEQVKSIIAIMIFFVIDAHHMLIRGIAYSLQELPVGAASLVPSLAGYLVALTGKIFSSAFRIGAPLIVTLFLVEIAFGMLARMIPQANVFVNGIPVKILITISMLGLSLGYIVPSIAGLFKGLETEFVRVIRTFG